jgi:putative membrane-bound dehydrogenase-like protein
MTRLPSIAAAILLASLTVASPPGSVAYAQPAGQPVGQPSKGAPTGPLDPAAALARFRLLDPHLTIELVAAEPEVIDPVSIAFDETGGMWVVEMRDYPWGPRRPGETVDSGEPRSVIKRLTDRDGDGRYETATVFADKLLFPTGLLPWKGGVIVTLAGEIAWMKDADGDGRADVRETWFRGFSQENSQLRANHPRLGQDGLVYVANGLRGGKVVPGDVWKRETKPLDLGSQDFRFDPHTGACTTVSGSGQFGLTFDAFGRRFVCSNRNPGMHVVLESEDVARNPRYAPPAIVHDAAAAAENSRVFPISKAWTTATFHAGQFTAACGVLAFRGAALDADGAGRIANGLTLFTCEPTGNLVHRTRATQLGGSFRENPSTVEQEFLASDDTWFRPVDLHEGPDGALYVVDMYRAVIEHPEWVPKELQNRSDERDGDDKGRIWRVRRKGTPRSSQPAVLTAAAQADPLADLSPNAGPWEIETRFRLVHERRGESSVDALTKLARDRSRPDVQARSLRALERFDGLTPALWSEAFDAASSPVREALVRLAHRVPENAEVAERLLANMATAENREVLETVLALGRLDDARRDQAVAGWVAALSSAYDDVWIPRAVACAAGDRLPRVLIGALSYRIEGQTRSGPHLTVLRELAHAVGKRRDAAEARAFLDAWGKVVDSPDETPPPPVTYGSNRIRGLVTINAFAEGWSPNPAEFRARLAAAMAENPQLAAARDRLAAEVRGLPPQADAVEPLDLERLRFLRLVDDPAWIGPLVALTRHEATPVRLQAVESLSAQSGPAALAALRKALPGQTPALRRAIVRALLTDPERQKALVAALREKLVAPTELDAAGMKRLVEHPDPATREAAIAIQKSLVPEDRERVLTAYKASLALAGDPAKGRVVFEKTCATCHKLDTLGVNVGPDIGDYSRTKTAEALLADILQPNRAIDNNYLAFAVLTKAGQTESGILAADTAASVTLRQPDGKTVTILKADIEEIGSSGLSLMPDGLEKSIDATQMADLIAFVRNWRYLSGEVPKDVRAK